MFLCTANLSGFEAIVVSYMRPYFAFLGLLLCLIAIRADEQKVIKDSEAIRYVGRYVEVYCLVVSVTASPFGTIFINFGRDTPIRRSLDSLQPIQKWQPTSSRACKGKPSASSAQSNFARVSRRLKSRRCLRS